MRKIDWLCCGLAITCLGWTLPAAAQYPVVTGARAAPAKQPQPGGDVRINVEDHNRLMEIRIELAWLSDSLTFPCLLVAHVDSTTLQATGYVPDRRVHDRALQIARLRCPMTVVDNLRERPQAATRLTRIEPAHLQGAALSSLQASFPQPRHLFQVHCDTDGRVKVSGFVASFEEKLAVSQTLRRVHGCSLVMNETHVSAAPRQLANAKRVDPIPAPAPLPPAFGIQRTQYVAPAEQADVVTMEPRQPVKAKPVKPINPIQAPANPQPPSGNIQRIQYVVPDDAKQTAQALPTVRANPVDLGKAPVDLGKARVSHGYVVVPDREIMSPAAKAALLQQRLAQACNIPISRIKLETRPGNVLDIQLTAATQAEYHRLIQRISQTPDVVPYRLHIHMKKAE